MSMERLLLENVQWYIVQQNGTCLGLGLAYSAWIPMVPLIECPFICLLFHVFGARNIYMAEFKFVAMKKMPEILVCLRER